MQIFHSLLQWRSHGRYRQMVHVRSRQPAQNSVRPQLQVRVVRVCNVSQDHPSFDAVEVVAERLLVALSCMLQIPFSSASLTWLAECLADCTAKFVVRGVPDDTKVSRNSKAVVWFCPIPQRSSRDLDLVIRAHNEDDLVNVSQPDVPAPRIEHPKPSRGVSSRREIR